MRFDDFKHDITFTSLCNIIQRKQELNSTSKMYIEWAENFFMEVSKSLDSILNPKENEGYYFMDPSLVEVINAYGMNTHDLSQTDLSNLKKEFNLISSKLNNFKTDASAFYKTKEAEETLNFMSKFTCLSKGDYSTKDLDGDD